MAFSPNGRHHITADEGELDRSVRIFGPGASVAQDIEPENIGVSANSRRAWVTLQENNAVAEVDLRRGRISDIVGLGFVDHDTGAHGIDASDEEARVEELALCEEEFGGAAALQAPTALGRLTVTTTAGFDAARGCYERLFSLGTRSFQIRTAEGALVFDSADEFEQITAAELPDDFKATTRRTTPSTTAATTRAPSPRASRSDARTGAPWRSSASSVSAG